MNAPAPLDLLVLGSGVAGLSAAVRAADRGLLRVGVLTKGELDQATTRWAQGGVAAVLGGSRDSTDLHFADTLAAGAGLCDPDAVRVLVDEGPARVKELIDLGADFDRDPDGELSLAREGGHSHARVVHAGGAATGVEVERALVAAVKQSVTALYEGWFACDLLVERGRCQGVIALPPAAPESAAPAPVAIRARHVLIATGGAGQLFSVTTNPVEATGDGIAMALRAGAALADLEFVQFHPTALHHPVRPRPLLSEALRGEGALLRDQRGDRFVDELLPRDQVSRAITRRMLDAGVEHLWLDATSLDDFSGRFPTIAASLAVAGLNPASDWLPVAPAAHYTCGGVLADLDGAASLPGLWVAGEAGCNGVHGANRLASNSLLDGMVFGARVVEAIERGKDSAEPTGAMGSVLTPASGTGPLVADLPEVGSASGGLDPTVAIDRLQRMMTLHAGVVRSAASLRIARSEVVAANPSPPSWGGGDGSGGPGAAGDQRRAWELTNLAAVAGVLCQAAQIREETRGAHTRTDHPEVSERLHRRLVVRADSGTSAPPT